MDCVLVIDTAVFDDPVLRVLSHRLKVPVPHIIGMILALWRSAEQCPGGDDDLLNDLTSDGLAELLGLESMDRLKILQTLCSTVKWGEEGFVIRDERRGYILNPAKGIRVAEAHLPA